MIRDSGILHVGRNWAVLLVLCAGALALAGLGGGTGSTSAVEPTWGSVLTVAGPDDASRADASVVLFPKGAPAVLWTESSAAGDPSGLFFSRKAGEGWGPWELIARDGQELQAAIDRRGVVTVAYERWRAGFGPEIVTKRRTLRGVWTKAEIISPVTKDDGAYTGARDSTLEVNGAGDAVAAWWWGSQDGGPEVRAQVSYRPAGGTWTALKDFERLGALADVVIGPGGTATVAYVDGGQLKSMQYRDGRWMPARRIARRGQGDVALSHATHGLVHAVWSQLTDTGQEVRHAIYTGGTWSPSRRLGGRNTRNTAPQVTVDRSGTATVVWLNQPDRRIQGLRLTSTGKKERVREVSGRGARYLITIAGNRAGDTVATWTTPLQSTENLYDRHLKVSYRGHAAADWSPPVAASDHEPVYPSGNQLVMAPDGQVSIAWVGEIYPQSALRVRQTVSGSEE